MPRFIHFGFCSRLLLVLLLCGLTNAVSPSDAQEKKGAKQENLLVNSGFRPQSMENRQPAAWKPSTWGGDPIFGIDRKESRKGFAVKISSATGANASWSQQVKVKRNSVYELSAWVKTENVDKGSGYGVVTNMHELGLDGKSDGLSGTMDWTQMKIRGNSGNRDSLLINLTFGAWGNATGTAWFDDIRFVEISSPNSFGPMNEDEAIKFYKDKVKPILKESCFECHGDDPEDLQGSLALTSRASILRGGDSGPAVDSNSPNESLLLKVINYEIYEMPPSGKLEEEKIRILSHWVKLGMPFAPGDEKDLVAGEHSKVPQVNEESKKWWAFQKVKKPRPPEVKNKAWPKSEIDNFILSKLESVSLTPAEPASRESLVRRAYYDLIGLPPTSDQVSAFVSSTEPDAYAKLIDELLESPHYGEKWGRHWLDLVRYAESNSFERDGTKPFVWRYRDYVIRAFNSDKPYDVFLSEQLAGDEMPNPSHEAIIATGYYRLGQWDDEPADPLKAKYDDLDDIIATTSQTMLGLTVNCARCHDHKIDPIPTADYYKMVSFFENIRRYGVRSNESVNDASVMTLLGGDASDDQKKRYENELAKLRDEMDAIHEKAKPGFQDVEHEDFKYEMNKLAILRKRIGKEINKKEFEKFKQLLNRQKEKIANPPGSIKVLCVKEAGPQAPATFVRIRGNAHVNGPKVTPGFISVLSPPDPVIETADSAKTTGRRLSFAKWITNPENPMTARVMVNRIWQYHFGRGIVRTSSDFGFQGAPPTHPELLDWLAATFVEKKWSIKQMHRMMMLSAAYQMASKHNATCYEKDPANDLFWKFNLRRLTAEEVRDSILAVSGQLNKDKMFGPSIFTKLPKEVLAGQSRPGQNWGNSSEEDRRRRSIYIHVKRSLSVPILSTNDSADTDNTCPVRFITTQPTQALGMLNSDFTNQQAKLFADSIRESNGGELKKQVATALEKVTQRSPTEKEVERGLNLIQALIDKEDVSQETAFEQFCLMALNLNEFVYLD